MLSKLFKRIGKFLNSFKRRYLRLPVWKKNIVSLLVLCMFISASFGINRYLQSQETAQTQYDIKQSDEIFSFGWNDLAKTEKFVVVQHTDAGVKGYLGNFRDVFVKQKGNPKITVFAQLSKEGYDEYYKSVLDPYRATNKKFEVVFASDLNHLNTALGVKDAPRELIVSDKQSALISTLVSIFSQILFLGLLLFFLLYFQKGMTASTITKIKPKDLNDSLDDLIGMDEIKKEVLQIEDMYLNPDLYTSYNANKPFNLMFTGPAGVGKTKLARCLAVRLNIPLFYCSAASLQSGFVGGGSSTLKKLMKAATVEGRAIIFLDEAESILQSRSEGAQHWEKETINTLLSLLDGVTKKKSHVIWIVASNMNEHTQRMDAATLRRFQLKINFRMPNFEERKQLLDVLLSKLDAKVLATDIYTPQLASLANGLSPANLESMVSRAGLIAIQQESLVTQDILIQAFERVTIGLTDRKTTENLQEQRLVIARHEIGHFVVKLDRVLKENEYNFAKVAQVIDVIKISTESISSLGALGFVFSKESEKVLHTRTEYEQMIVQLYGGMASEELYYSQAGVTSGAQNDIEKVSALLLDMVCKVGFYQDAKLNYLVLKDVNKNTDTTTQIIQQKSAELYAEALNIVTSYQPIMDVLVEALMQHYVLSIEDALAIVEQCLMNEIKDV